MLFLWLYKSAELQKLVILTLLGAESYQMEEKPTIH